MPHETKHGTDHKPVPSKDFQGLPLLGSNQDSSDPECHAPTDGRGQARTTEGRATDEGTEPDHVSRREAGASHGSSHDTSHAGAPCGTDPAAPAREPQEGATPKPLYHEGFTEVAPNVYVGHGEVVVRGMPPQSDDEEAGHNCDAMGCGWDHVLWRAPLATPAAASGAGTVAASDDAIMLQRVEELEIVVRPMVGGGFGWEDSEGEWDGRRHPTWRHAAWAAIRSITGETPDAPLVPSNG